ncbi:carboxylesterase/lipase family protein [Micromonosporaceae bacterium Da 78-11]
MATMDVDVRTPNGVVRGRWENGVAVFRGIPFAAPPVGSRRFAAPEPAEPWDGVRDAGRFGPAPPQPGRQAEGDDWLNLTVWTPDPGRADLPVVVWISGGGYLNCDTADPYLTGAAVAAAGAVLVSANYRSGFEGFAHVDGAPANRALLDQRAALAWVQDTVGRFGGDPGNVTVLGQSAGAGSIAALLTRPAGIRRAILQSTPGTYFTAGLAADISAEICGRLGRSPTVGDLTDVAPDDLVAAAQAVTRDLTRRFDRWGSVAWSSTPFAPVVDGDVLTTDPWSALAGGSARGVDLLIGHTRDEYRLLAAHLPDTDDARTDALIDGLSPTPGAESYRTALPAAEARQRRETALADWLYRMPTVHLAEAADRGGARVRLYELCWGFGPNGASHGLDTLLLFGTADLDGEVTAAGRTTVAAHLAQLVRAEHLAFAATGDPGWTRFRAVQPWTRVYRPDPALVAYPEHLSRTLWSNERFAALDRPGSTHQDPEPDPPVRDSPPVPCEPGT